MTETERQPEATRRLYLDAMGVQAWYPRVRLPVAPEPIIFDLDDTPATTPEQPPAPPEPVDTRPARQAEAAPPATEVEAPPARRAAGTSQAVPRFVLSLSVVGPYLVADTLARGLEQPTPAGQQLLVNILATLGVSNRDVRTHHIIQWPLFTNPRVDQGIDQARIYVDEKLEQFVRQFRPERLLSFGAALPRLHGWESPAGEHAGLPWVGLPSLYRMLDDPRQKAVAWQRLKPLVPAAE